MWRGGPVIMPPTCCSPADPRRPGHATIGTGAGRVPPGPREGLCPPPTHRPCGCGLFLGLSSGPQADEGDAMSGSLPERPDLGQLRRRAKELRDAARRGDAAALDRFARHHSPAPRGTVSLAAAQLVIARELGFASWPRLRAAIDTE